MNKNYVDIGLDEIVEKSQPARLPEQCGIYFLLRGNVVVYVGQTEWFWQRLRAHMKDSRKDWDRFCFIEVPIDLLNEVEHHFIFKFKPEYNHHKPHSKSIAPPQLIAYPHSRFKRKPPAGLGRH
jgi:excinuclease UvrABC nuclease subunit